MKARSEKKVEGKVGGGTSKLKLALGAAGLFLFIVGVKRTFRDADAQVQAGDEPADRAAADSGR